MSVESPAYEVLRHDGPFELRRYHGYITADVRVPASGYGQAANAGFNPLADYIFGNNRESGRIAMTAPVSAGRASGRTIAMTAPVTTSYRRPTTRPSRSGRSVDRRSQRCGSAAI
jgi:hypothetical protein